MSETTELIAQQILGGNINKRTWGDILYNVKVYGAYGDGVKDDTALIESALGAASSVGGIVFFPSGTYKAGNLTVPTNVTLWFTNGSELSINAGATVTINGPVSAGLYQIFSGSGTVTGFNKVKELYPQWWGAVGDSVTDDTAGFQKAVAACPAGGRISVPVPSQYYVVKGNLTFSKNITFAGENATDNQNGGGLNSRIIFYENGYDTAINITASGVRIENIMLQYPGGGTTLIYGVVADSMINITLDRVWLRNFKYPVYFTNCIQCSFRQVNIRDCDIGFRFEVGGTSMYLEQCWVESPLVTGYQMMSHVYCTFVNCLLDGFSGSEPDYAYKIYDSFTIKFVNCASEKVKKSHFYLESCREVSLDTCFGTTGNISTTHLCSFAHINVTSDNISFINCKDYQPVGTEMSVTNSTSTPPLFVSCDFPNKFSDVGTVCTIEKNAINIGQASFAKDGVTVLSPNGTRHKIVVSDSNVISATTVSG